MKTFRVGPCNPLDLLLELRAVRIQALTVRASWADIRDEVCIHAVVVTEDAAKDADVESVIAAHLASVEVAGKSPTRDVFLSDAAAREASLVAMEKVISGKGR